MSDVTGSSNAKLDELIEYMEACALIARNGADIHPGSKELRHHADMVAAAVAALRSAHEPPCDAAIEAAVARVETELSLPGNEPESDPSFVADIRTLITAARAGQPPGVDIEAMAAEITETYDRAGIVGVLKRYLSEPRACHRDHADLIGIGHKFCHQCGTALTKLPEHRCGVQGFNQMKGDVCPACSSQGERNDAG